MCHGVVCDRSTQLKREELFLCPLTELSAITKAILIVKAMLPFSMHKRNRVRLERWITIDVWDDTDLSVGTFLDETAHRSSIGRRWMCSGCVTVVWWHGN